MKNVEQCEALKRLLGPNALSLAEVAERLKLSPSTLRRRLNDGTLAKPLEFGPTLKRYIPELVAKRLAELMETKSVESTHRARGRPRKASPALSPHSESGENSSPRQDK